MASGKGFEILVKGLACALSETQEFCDLTILCQGREFRVHKVVLCAQSSFFAKACKSDFEEAHTNIIDLSEDDPDVVCALISYFYTFNYEWPTKENSTAAIHPLIGHVRMHATADRLDVQGLKTLARNNFAELAEIAWTHAEFPAAVKEVYETTVSTDRELRGVARDVVKNNICALLKKENFVRVLGDVAEMGLDLVQLFASRSPPKRSPSPDITYSKCKKCKLSCKCSRGHVFARGSEDFDAW